MTSAKATICFVFVLSIFAFSAANTMAQSFGINTDATIKIKPAYPEPNTDVTASLDAYAINTTGANISWYIDGSEVVNAKNLREITFAVGDLGTPIKISAQITPKSGLPITAARTIIPTRVDIVVEADTLVPLHYKGRALPSSGSIVRVIAVPDTTVAPSELSYTWILDNKVLFGGSLIGKNIARFEAPKSPRVLLTLEVSDTQGTTLTRKSTFIDIVAPEIHFYEENPLRGLSQNAIVSPHLLIGDEMTLRAEPYFMDTKIFESDPLLQWEVNNTVVQNPSNDPQNITLRSGQGTGNFSVDFHIRNLQNLLQGVEDGFMVTF
ncbi:MAG: hypothetical protein ACI9VM_000863 [Candidatus Azotimanducaceae bacterium]|jgi:hypothetical protein